MLSASFVDLVYLISSFTLIFIALFLILSKGLSSFLISASKDTMNENPTGITKRVGRGLGKNNLRDQEDPDDLLNREIMKQFFSDDIKQLKNFKGIVESYDATSVYTVKYSDGDKEQLSTYQIKKKLTTPFVRRLKATAGFTLGENSSRNDSEEIDKRNENVGKDEGIREELFDVEQAALVYTNEDFEEFGNTYEKSVGMNVENNSSTHNSASIPVLEDDPLDDYELMSDRDLEDRAKIFDIKDNNINNLANIQVNLQNKIINVDCAESKATKRKRNSSECPDKLPNKTNAKNTEINGSTALNFIHESSRIYTDSKANKRKRDDIISSNVNITNNIKKNKTNIDAITEDSSSYNESTQNNLRKNN